MYKRSLLARGCLKQHQLRLHGGPGCSSVLLQLQQRLPLALSWCSTAPLRFRKATTSLCLWRTASMMGVPLYLGAANQPINNDARVKQHCLAAPAAAGRHPTGRDGPDVPLHLKLVAPGSACSLADGWLHTAACSGNFLQRAGRQPCL